MPLVGTPNLAVLNCEPEPPHVRCQLSSVTGAGVGARLLNQTEKSMYQTYALFGATILVVFVLLLAVDGALLN